LIEAKECKETVVPFYCYCRTKEEKIKESEETEEKINTLFLGMHYNLNSVNGI